MRQFTMAQQMDPIAGYATTMKIVSPGDGAAVKAGDTVTVHATGVVKETDKKFWSTKDPGQQPFTYQAGVGGVITGWDQGCLGMQIGEVRLLEIPAHEGYGANGFPAWGIPPGGTLFFTLECLKIE
mmetsp:Transcript_247/g.619  ORF Transcript_247/g.619 Transcript_247/m.619 type:complete len:126 (-) Transcript_247:86-463(-)